MDDPRLSDEPRWAPDRKTVDWWMGAASDKRIVEPLIREVRERGTDITYDTDTYWHLLADVAVRLVNEDMPVMVELQIASAAKTKKWLEENPDSIEASPENARWRASVAWLPDPETVRWWTTIATGDRIVESLEEEVKRRGGHLEPDSDAYYHFVADVAVEHLYFELYETAKEWGTDVGRKSGNEQTTGG